MKNMTSKTSGLVHLACFSLLALLATGCVSQSQYDQLQEVYRTGIEQNEELRIQLEAAQAHLATLENEIQSLQGTISDKGSSASDLASARKQLAYLTSQLASAKAKINELANGQRPLPAKLNAQLARLAQSHPQLMTYDAKQGKVQLTSDLTFALGSDQVSDQAKASLMQLANILNSDIANQYEVRVVGHTDNVRIANPATKAKHPTNWHLSVHRAISIKNELNQSKVANTRLSVAGYGAFRPIQLNTRRGSRANRRVEIYLVPNTYQSLAGAQPMDATSHPITPEENSTSKPHVVPPSAMAGGRSGSELAEHADDDTPAK